MRRDSIVADDDALDLHLLKQLNPGASDERDRNEQHLARRGSRNCAVYGRGISRGC